MASFGENLRKAREARKITLQEIAETTKIGTRALQAMEADRFDQLPGGIFNKGFVRSYARAVGLNEEKTVAEYLAATKAETPEIDMSAMSAQVSKPVVVRRDSSAPSGVTLMGVLALLVALGVGALWLHEHRKEASEAVPQSRAESNVAAPPVAPALPPTTAAPSDTPTGVSTTENSANPGALSANPTANPSANQPPNVNVNQTAVPATPKTEPALASPKETEAAIQISISATEKAWIRVSSDGKTVDSLILDPENPEKRSRNYSAKEKLMLVVGNPAGLSVTYNGKPTGTLGDEGRRATITFTPGGMEKH